MTQVITIKTKWAPACAVSLFPLWCKGGKRRRGVPRHQAKVSLSVQRDQDKQDGRTEVTVEPRRHHHQHLWQTKTTFSPDNFY